MVDRNNEGQLHTLEGIAASAALLLAITYAFNAFVVTPTSDVNPGAQVNQRVAQDLLEASSSNDNLKDALLNWNDTAEAKQFMNSSPGTYYYEGEDPDVGHLDFGNNTQSAFSDQGLSYNIEVVFSRDNETGSLTFVNNGRPGPSAVTATQRVTLADDDEVIDFDEPDNRVNITNTSTYPIPKEGEGIYNRAEFRVTVW